MPLSKVPLWTSTMVPSGIQAINQILYWKGVRAKLQGVRVDIHIKNFNKEGSFTTDHFRLSLDESKQQIKKAYTHMNGSKKRKIGEMPGLGRLLMQQLR